MYNVLLRQQNFNPPTTSSTTLYGLKQLIRIIKGRFVTGIRANQARFSEIGTQYLDRASSDTLGSISGIRNAGFQAVGFPYRRFL